MVDPTAKHLLRLNETGVPHQGCRLEEQQQAGAQTLMAGGSLNGFTSVGLPPAIKPPSRTRELTTGRRGPVRPVRDDVSHKLSGRMGKPRQKNKCSLLAKEKQDKFKVVWPAKRCHPSLLSYPKINAKDGVRDKTGAVVVMEVLRLYTLLVNPRVFQTAPGTMTSSGFVFTTSEEKKKKKATKTTTIWSQMTEPFGKHKNKNLPSLFLINVCFP